MPFENSVSHPVSKEQFQEFLQCITSLERRLGQSLSSKEKNSVVCIPSLQFPLGLLYAGARGKTFSELEALLGFSGPQVEKFSFFKSLLSYFQIPEIKVANAAYVSYTIDLTPEFKDLSKKYFNVSFEKVDFAQKKECVEKINTWASEATEKLIKSIITENAITPELQLVLLNAIYFKAKWKKPFKALYSKDGQFFISEMEETKVTFMNDTSYYSYAEDAKYKYLKKPYRCPNQEYNLYMLLVLPKNFRIFEEEYLFQIDIDSLAFKEYETILKLPKFEVESEIDPNEILEAKIPSSYCIKTANFLSISETPLAPPLHVSDIIQKAVIKVNERGTEAAALTRVRLRGGGNWVPPERKEFICDRPFHYAVVIEIEKKKVMLFQGTVVKPSLHPPPVYDHETFYRCDPDSD